MALSEKQCVPCKGGVPPLTPEEQKPLLQEVPEWTAVQGHHLHRLFRFPDFAQALVFTNKVGALAEQQGHHPDLHLAWGQVGVEIWTHKIDGLTESDFVLAAKIDAIAR